jgi:CBS domain-containing membrane protein
VTGPRRDIRRTTTLRVRDVMTAPAKTLGRNDRLSAADDLMTANRIRHVPIVDEDGELSGIVSRHDLFRGALARALGYGDLAQRKLLDTLAVKEVMTTDVVTTTADAPLADAANRMLGRKIGCLPVVDGTRLVGIVSESDFVKLAAEGRDHFTRSTGHRQRRPTL